MTKTICNQKRVFDYLKGILTTRNRPNNCRFQELGPHTLLCNSKPDKIVVYVNACNLVILHDGENILDSLEMIPLLAIDDEDVMDDYYLQPILHKF